MNWSFRSKESHLSLSLRTFSHFKTAKRFYLNEQAALYGWLDQCLVHSFRWPCLPDLGAEYASWKWNQATNLKHHHFRQMSLKSSFCHMKLNLLWWPFDCFMPIESSEFYHDSLGSRIFWMYRQASILI